MCHEVALFLPRQYSSTAVLHCWAIHVILHSIHVVILSTAVQSTVDTVAITAVVGSGRYCSLIACLLLAAHVDSTIDAILLSTLRAAHWQAYSY